MSYQPLHAHRNNFCGYSSQKLKFLSDDWVISVTKSKARLNDIIEKMKPNNRLNNSDHSIMSKVQGSLIGSLLRIKTVPVGLFPGFGSCCLGL